MVAKPAKKSSGKRMRVVSGELCFWVNNGPILSSLFDLHKALLHMSEQQFAHHVGKQKNDFAAWVKGVLAEESCAKKLLSAKNKKAAAKAVESILASYK